MFIRITKKTMGYLFLIVSLILPPIPVQWVYADETVGFFEDIIGVTDPDVLVFEDELADEGEAGRNETDLDESITEDDSNDNDDKLEFFEEEVLGEEFFEEEVLEEEVFEESVDSDAKEMAEDIFEESSDLEEGVWGTVRWTYNEANKTMILYGGVAGVFGSLPWRAYRRTIEHIIVAERVQLPPDSAQLFEGCVSLQSIQNEHNFDTSLVTNMRGLFLETPSLKSLDLSTWDTRSVEILTHFIARSGIESLDISGFDMRAVTNMRGMFSQSVHLKELSLGEQSLLHSTGNVGSTADIPQISVSGRYTGRWVLRESLGWETGRIAYEDSLTLATEYDGRYPGTYIWEEHLWGTVPWAYDEDTQTITLYAGTAGLVESAPWKTHDLVKRILVEGQVILPIDSGRLFADLDELIEIESGHNLDVSQVRDLSRMFHRNKNLERVDVSNWDVSSVTNMEAMFSSCEKLTTLDVSDWDTRNVTNMSFIFNECKALLEVDVSKWDTSKAETMASLFRWCSNLSVIDVSNWDTRNVTVMSYVFDECRELIELDVSNWDTKKVVNMESLFQYCVKLSVIDVSEWDVGKVENMAWLFNQCQSVEVLDVRNWNTESAKIMNTMFNNCMQVEILDVSNWQTANVTNMRIMFTKLEKVKTLDVSEWDTSSVTNIQGMFLNCFQLTKVDISNWNLDAVPAENIDFLFENCYQLKEIVLGSNTRLSTIVLLPEVADTDNYTGAWRLRNSDVYQDTIKFESSEAFMRDFDGSHPGTYVWERTIPASFTASFDPVSDQVSVITGVAFEEADALRISYQNLDGTTYEIDPNSAQFEWLTYQDEQAGLRKFQIKLAENERVATDSTVTLWMARPSHDHESIEVQKEVVKGVRYQASDFTLSAERLAQVTTLSELHTLIIEDSGARAVDVLSQQDVTEEFRVVETDLSLDISEDGSYYAVLEIGHKAYQITIGIDVTSKLEHMRVTIPTKMIFESLYNETESNRGFESPSYEIRNHSSIEVDTYVNRIAVDDDAGIVLLAEGEDPLDHTDIDNPSLEDISTPLLRLNIKTGAEEVQLYEAMAEKHLLRLSESSVVPLSLTGHFYGDYPRWVVDPEAEQGGYYEDSLVPRYRMVLRFVPRP